MSQSHPIFSKNRGYEENCKDSIISPNTGKQLKIFDIRLLNRSGSTSDIAYFKQLAPTSLSYFSLVGGAPANITASIAAGTSTGIFTTTNGDGIAIQSKNQFHMVGITVSTAQTGSPVITVNYWNGTAFTAVPNVIVTPVYTSLGYQFLLFNCPRDWVVGSGGLAGLDNTKYTLEITAASSTLGRASAIQVGEMLDFADQVPSSGGFERSYSIDYPLYLDASESIIPYFGVASSKNMVTISYSQED